MPTPRMHATHAPGADGAAREIGHTAHEVADSSVVRNLIRAGYVARGVIYLVPGYLALRLAVGTHGAAITQTGAIDYIAKQPFGHALLIALAAGLAGYSLWGVIRAVFDPTHEGHETKGILKRFGFATSALAYLGLFIATTQYLSGAFSHVANQHGGTPALLARPNGQWLVAIVGLFWIVGAGFTQIVHGWSKGFVDDLDLSRVGATERKWAITLGRVGIVARGIVFTIIGMLMVGAARQHDAVAANGMDGALKALLHQPFGRPLLAIVALGLVVFGVFSILCARWMRLDLDARDSRSHPGSA